MKTRPCAPGLSALIARGVLADSRWRRRSMGGIVLAAAAMLMLGATFWDDWLAARPFVFLLYWLAVAWLTVTALLMAVLDILLVRRAGRVATNRLREQLRQRGENKAPDE